MSTGGEPGHEHPIRTRNDTNYRYFFYDKHHGRGGPKDARWVTDLSEDEEFAIFDQADTLDLLDTHGNLYGLRIGAVVPREVLVLGTLGQTVAKFPLAHADHPWHGYPLGPVRPIGPLHPPIRTVPREVLRRMVAMGLLTGAQRRRIEGGKDP